MFCDLYTISVTFLQSSHYKLLLSLSTVRLRLATDVDRSAVFKLRKCDRLRSQYAVREYYFKTERRCLLYAENWAYILSDSDEADKTQLMGGHYSAVDFSGCLDRLERLCGELGYRV